jgi:hypothetical protein
VERIHDGSTIRAPMVKGKAFLLQAWTGSWGFQEVQAFRISRQLAHEGGRVVGPTHRPSLPPGRIPGTHSC